MIGAVSKASGQSLLGDQDIMLPRSKLASPFALAGVNIMFYARKKSQALITIGSRAKIKVVRF